MARQGWLRAGIFILMTFLLNWAYFSAFWALGGRFDSRFALPVLLGYMAIPALVAIFIQRVIFREQVVKPLGLSFRLNGWFVVGWLAPVVVALAAFGVAMLFPQVEFSRSMAGMFEQFKDRLTPEQIAQARRSVATIPPAALLLISVIQGLIAGATVNGLAALGEELGWRGYLQRALAFLGFWPSSLLIGVIWGLWHAPLILKGYNYPQHPRLGVWMMVAFATLYAPLISYVRVRARSVIAAAIMHGTINGTAGIAILFLAGGTDLTNGIMGAAGLIVLAVMNLVLLVYDRFIAKTPVRLEMAHLLEPAPKRVTNAPADGE